jgi:tRNA(Ile)-lysidine synthase
MALAWFFRAFYPGKLTVAHIEHGIRGSDSVLDASHVEMYAAKWGLDAEILHADVPGSLKKGESLETGARRVRYDFFERAAEKHNAWGVALGHNMEDAAETVLFNLLRGGGVLGAAGMPERRGIFFRPLLELKRGFLREILRCRGIEWRDDKTNADADYTRNFIRNKLMPLIEGNINARAAEHLSGFARDMRELGDEEKEKGDALLEEIGVADTDLVTIDRSGARDLSDRERALLIRATGRRMSAPVLSRRQCLKLAGLVSGRKPFTFQWSGDIVVMGTHNEVAFTRISP